MKMLAIGDLAKKAGVSVRTLRYYDTRGLLNPIRSESGQRFYTFKDVVRLGHIQLLKRTGFSLNQIYKMIEEKTIDGDRLLKMNHALLVKERDDLNKAIGILDEAIKNLDGQAETDLSTLCNHIKLGEQSMSSEEDWQKVWDTYYTPEENAKWAAAKSNVSMDNWKEIEQAWPDVLARTEKLVGSDPASPEAQALLKEWNALSQPIYDIDPSLAGSVTKMYDNLDSWPQDGPQMPFSKEVWEFIKAAGEAAKQLN
ncbi:MerR family transcriptional regulator [Kordiimonas sp. SCSIO 12610]|uniref:MerR family transcriptional regulator n=1 Tax=Kordiimonas sp. SCSIO 12610 TaxID=2829597 RepID=UPI0021092AC4|nr:MerR family transcriptional regulator [Kordiimonas sp. SCSIO 12610]UTW55615.1 MerR family transcriptional regulator [Kordiimonas sp. SCSIO 12610]